MAHTLFIRDGESFREAPAQDVIDRAAALIAQHFRTGAPAFTSPGRTRQYLRHQIGALPYEVFGLLLLDNRHRLIRAEDPFRGTIDGASVHPREVVRTVLEANAAAVILCHNHPLCFVWGVTTPVIGAENHPICRPRKNGMGSCLVSSGRITPVSPSRRLRCSRALARSSTRRVAVRPACDGCAAA